MKLFKTILKPRGYGEIMFERYINKRKCNHAVGFCRDMVGWLYYEDFTLYMNSRIYYSYSRHCAFDYCPLCGKNIKKIQREVWNIKNNWYESKVNKINDK